MQPNEIDSSVINLIQSCIDKSYIKLQTNTSIIDEPEFSTKEYSYFDRFKFIYLQSMSWSYSTVTLLVILITYLVEMTYIVKEKTSGSNVLMSLNGVDNWLNLLSWLVTGVIWNMPLVVTIVLLLKYSWVSDVHLFLTNGNTIVVILLLLLHVIHLFCFGYHVASYFNEGVGIGFTNMFLIEFDRKPFEASIGMIMILSIFAAMFHFFMALYIHAILPDKYGVKCHPFGWFLNKNKTENSQIQLDSDELEQNEDFEKIPAGSLVAGVQIRGLEKNYNTGLIRKNEFHALKGVSMDFYHGEITALLGHNGAGKTTMMSILSGLIESSNGVVIINGKNILDDNVINDNVGLCPQVNITVPDLNVYQQVLFFAKLRGKNKTPAQIKDDVDNLISKVNLQDKKNCIPDQLSGGQKRRLCLAMAVIGDANVLIFDEPTSGLDAESKREVWDIILALKSDKTILISTHDMEEADILGDRIAIMHSGRLSSYGSSMFLKKYHGNNQVEVSLSLEPDCDTSKILESICDNVKILNQRNNTIVLAIPNTQSLPEVLDKLENTKKHLGITGISASIISLEQVFVKVTNEHDDNIDEKNNEINNDSKLFDKTTGLDYFMQTFWGYLMKKYAYAMKNPWSFILRLILPCLITASMLLYLLESSEPIDTTNLSLNNQSILFYKKWKDTEDKLISNEHITKRISDKEMIPLGERTTGIKLLQDMTGASKILYWATMFIVDFVHYTITILLLLTSLILVDNILNTQLYNFENIPVLLLLFLAFGITGLPSVYVVILPLGISLLCEIFYGLLYKEYQDKNQPVPSVLILANIFLLIPQVNFCYSIIHFHWIIYNNAIYLINPNDRIIEPYWSFKKYGQLLSLPYCLIIFVISLIIFIAIMIIVEQKLITKIIRKIRKNNLSISTIETDELVQKETAIVSERIEKHLTKIADDDEDNENVFLAHELKKNYGNLQAVKGISFRVKTRECFGLLGVNGAGKSTTFKMLTGEESPHHGMMYLKQTGMHENHRKYLSQMGYCPQHDALIEPLNAWDHLYLFARLRGIPESQIKLSVEGWIKQLNLGACASRPSHTYSGGNKRRLNIALALIGRPSLILMDEPTTGVDPAARRSLWRTLNYCQNSGQSMILTSHSMEECEILCNRLVIMVNGKLVCVGAVQELKQRFGAGYNIHIKISHVSTAEDVQQIKFTIESTIICQKMDENSGFLGYHVTDPCATWTVMYGMMNTLKNNYKCIEDFTVLSSTLEQLFIQFARAENHHHENLP
ncbi:ATP-binding cassette sub-family A member 17-like [Aphidius gifuensis]|uniref:ATP-binding cassette sub-family A member 17-like n=1 Tax=Aphidius gifuensis TaxID=684658 RepID=UPI001CDCDB62|nr:ATP-binding cassette sub-family A member 17-like [Aphidius gifuensis]